MYPRRSLALVALAVLCTTSACGSGSLSDAKVVTTGGVAVLTGDTSHRGDFSQAMPLVGWLKVVGGECVGFGDTQSGTLLIFPAGTTVSGSGADIAIHSGNTTMHLGDQVKGASVDADPAPLSSFGDLDSQVPSSCSGLSAVTLDDVEGT